MTDSTLVLGLDPGTATTGYGLVRERDGALEVVGYGVITTPARAPLLRGCNASTAS